MAQNAKRFRKRKRAFSLEPGAQRLTLDERHRVIQDAIHLSGLKEWDDVRMLKARRQLNLKPEPFSLDLRGELTRENLHGDSPAEDLVVSHEQPAHGSAVKLVLEGVGLPESFSQRFKEIGQSATRE